MRLKGQMLSSVSNRERERRNELIFRVDERLSILRDGSLIRGNGGERYLNATVYRVKETRLELIKSEIVLGIVCAYADKRVIEIGVIDDSLFDR